MRLKLAPNPVYTSLQGEGALQGDRHLFVRLAGCDVNCPECDTDYTVDSVVDVEALAQRVLRTAMPVVWVTGGEPTLQRGLWPFVKLLRDEGRVVCLATSGHRDAPTVDFLSVSPHSLREPRLVKGDELKLIDGLNGLDPAAWIETYGDKVEFQNKYLHPRSVRTPSGRFCLDLASVDRMKGLAWSLEGWDYGYQKHHEWGMP